MKSVRAKLILQLLVCVLISVLICGGINVYNAMETSSGSALEKLQLESRIQSNQMQNKLSEISYSVNGLAKLSLASLGDFNKVKDRTEYVNSVSTSLFPLFKQCSEQINGALTYIFVSILKRQSQPQVSF